MPPEVDERIARLNGFKTKLIKWDNSVDRHVKDQLRGELNQEKALVRKELAELRCLKVFTLSPPPILGGLVMRNVDLFDHLFDRPYNQAVIPLIVDMIDDGIGRLKAGMIPLPPPPAAVAVDAIVQQGYAFVVMAIDPADPDLVDVLDSIKEGAMRCGIIAERIDEVEANERITDRILESIRRAEYVIVDITHPKPNVFYEAGFAQGIGKLPIYVARHGTPLQFDLKDYPTIFFRNMKELKDGLEKRLRALDAAAAKRA